MQIHEITLPTLQEGVFSNIGRGLAGGLAGVDIPQSQASIERDAAAAAGKLRAQGYGQPPKELSPQDAIAQVQKNTAQQQFIKGLVGQWQKVAPKPTPATGVAGTTAATTAPFAGTAAPLPTVTVNGKLLTKGPDGLWHGEDGRAVTDPGQAAKIDKAYYTGMRNQKGVVKEAFRTPQQTAAVKAQRRRPTTASPATVDPYKTEFEQWAAEKLLTKDPTTRRMISLDDIKNTDIGDELSRALDQVASTANDPQKNAVAVNNYLTIAVAGVTKISQKLKQSAGTGQSAGAVATGTAGQGIVTQKQLIDKLGQEVGLTDRQLEPLKKIIQDPAQRQALMKFGGVA